MKDTGILTAYFSRAGENYVNGGIRDLPVGNTEAVARLVQSVVGGELFRIDTMKPYPTGYTRATEVAREELNRNERPKLSSNLESIAAYGTVFLGYPNWWGTMPMAVFTFLESHDFSGKTILPFCTHEGSRMGTSVRDMRRLLPGAEILDGLAIRGGVVKSARDEVTAWLRKIGF